MTQLEAMERLVKIWDAADACESILSATAGRTLEDYRSDWLLRAAVERLFIKLGEAIRGAITENPSLRDTLPDAREIIAFRNRLVHNYSDTDDEQVWSIVRTEIPRLLAQLRALLA